MCQSHLTAPASVFRIAVAPNASFLSLYTDDNRVVVFTSDYSKSLSEFQCEVISHSVCFCCKLLGGSPADAPSVAISCLLAPGGFGAGPDGLVRH